MASGFLLQMAGGPGSGKSTLARAVGAKVSAVVIDIDVVKSAILDAGAGWELASRAAYGALFALAGDQLSQGRRVIIDSACHYPEIVDQGIDAARAHGVRYAFVECRCADPDLIPARLGAAHRRRSHWQGVERPPHDAERAGGAMARPGLRVTIRPPASVLEVDTTRPLADCVAEVIAFLAD